jgi:uncharacterized protein (UPF0276 family)
VVAVAAAGVVVVVEASHRYAGLPNLGAGIGYRPVFSNQWLGHRRSIDFMEIVADHYFHPSPIKSAELDLLANNVPLIPHGLALSIGSAEGIDSTYLNSFQTVVDRVRPAWCSDHIAFTRAGGIEIGHLTPLPKTRAALQVLRTNIRRVQDSIAVPLILENITESIRYAEDEFSDAEFLGQVCDDNDVGLLLDVTNLYINSINHRFDPLSVLHRLPADRIVQLHFVGGHMENGIWVDTHGAATQEEIWSLLGEVLQYAPVKGIILERDENIPPLSELIPELDRARGLMHPCSA